MPKISIQSFLPYEHASLAFFWVLSFWHKFEVPGAIAFMAILLAPYFLAGFSAAYISRPTLFCLTWLLI